MSKKRFRQLTRTDRLKIRWCLDHGMKKGQIAEELGVHRNTITNELKRGAYIHRNSDWTEEVRYSPEIAHQKHKEAGTHKGPNLKIGNDFELANYIEKRIVEDDLSPEAVLGEIQQKGLKFDTTICVTTLYSYIRKGVFLTLEMKHLPRKGKSKQKYDHVTKTGKRAPAGASIERRPPEIATREHYGDWEMDLIVGCKGSRAVLLTMDERKSRKRIEMKLKDKTAVSVRKAIDRLERRYGTRRFRAIFKSITVDNGSEFQDCEGMERSFRGSAEPRTKMFYCHPYSSYERGTNENQNGMTRRKFPKGTNFDHVTPAQVQAAEDWQNDYPRAILGFRTANEVFNEWLETL